MTERNMSDTWDDPTIAELGWLVQWAKDSAVGPNGEIPMFEIQCRGGQWSVLARSFFDGHSNSGKDQPSPTRYSPNLHTVLVDVKEHLERFIQEAPDDEKIQQAAHQVVSATRGRISRRDAEKWIRSAKVPPLPKPAPRKAR
jgi:hypothetical protein